MAKLSLAQMAALTQIHEGATITARKSTLDVLVRDDYLAMYTTGYVLTDKAYALGFKRPSEQNAKPFVVQQRIGNMWMRYDDRAAHTFGTANVWRNRLAALGLTVRVHNLTTDQVWA